MSMQPIGHYDLLRERAERVAKANPHLAGRILGIKIEKPAPPPPSKPILVVAPRKLPNSIWRVMHLVAEQSGLTINDIRGNSKRAAVVNARSVIANLCVLLLGKSFDSLDRELNRGDGMSDYYIKRHGDRLKLYPEYRELYERCAKELGASL